MCYNLKVILHTLWPIRINSAITYHFPADVNLNINYEKVDYFVVFLIVFPFGCKGLNAYVIHIHTHLCVKQYKEGLRSVLSAAATKNKI